MNQTCKVCGEPAAGFHFGAFTCEGCKSFFGRSYNNLSSISECKNNGKCIIDKKNRTTCKACRLRKCYTVGMSKGGSRYGRRSNWFKIHCLLQEQQQQAVEAAGKAAAGVGNPANGTGFNDMAAAVAAQQQMHQRNAHLSAPHMGALLGYPSYLPEMMQTSGSPFMSAAGRHPADAAAAAAALPFFSMINSLPTIGSPQSAFQLPPHLLFSGAYHPSAAAAAAADAAYRNEMFKHRQSVDSAASVDSQSRYSPAARSTDERLPSSVSRQSPELCVSGDDDDHLSVDGCSTLSHHSNSPMSVTQQQQQQQQQQQKHHIHSPIPIRATPKIVSPLPTLAAATTCTTTPQSQPRTPEPATGQAAPMTNSVAYPTAAIAPATTVGEQMTLSFTAKMQALSPVSVCSISNETAITPQHAAHTKTAAHNNDQDCPMDLSMKTTRSSAQSFNTSNGESDIQSDSGEESTNAAMLITARRKFYQLNNSDHEIDTSTSSSSSSVEAVKRQKISDSTADASSSSQNFNGFGATSLRSIYVCT